MTDANPAGTTPVGPDSTPSDFAKRLIVEAFATPHSDYEAEVHRASELTGVKFATIRPVFLSGDPADVRAGEYVLFLGLNPKLDLKRPANTAHYEHINRNAESNAAYTLRYFQNIETLHGYFRSRAKVLRSYLQDLGRPSDADDRTLLSQHSLFLEHVPFHSERTAGNSLDALDELRSVQGARNLLRSILAAHPPGAIVLDGVATHGLLSCSGLPKVHQLASRTKSGICTVSTYHHAGITVLRCSFIRSRYGPNSNQQLAELGRLLAEGRRRALAVP